MERGAWRQIFAIGGGAFAEREGPLLAEHVLSLARGERPKVCFIPTAGGDSPDGIVAFYRLMWQFPCVPFDLQLFPRTVTDLRGFVLAQDVLWVGGGSTANMLAVWRVHGLDEILREAYEQGIVLTGSSAGMNCWFEASVTDSFSPTELAGLDDGLGFLEGSACPHFDGEPLRRPTYHRLVADGFPPGIAADDHVGVHYVDERLEQVVSARPGATAYRVEARDGGATETPLDAVELT
ncbi:MAG TPA: peptidase E [Thermoleophilaceae bacterium]